MMRAFDENEAEFTKIVDNVDTLSVSLSKNIFQTASVQIEEKGGRGATVTTGFILRQLKN